MLCHQPTKLAFVGDFLTSLQNTNHPTFCSTSWVKHCTQSHSDGHISFATYVTLRWLGAQPYFNMFCFCHQLIFPCVHCFCQDHYICGVSVQLDFVIQKICATAVSPVLVHSFLGLDLPYQSWQRQSVSPVASVCSDLLLVTLETERQTAVADEAATQIPRQDTADAKSNRFILVVFFVVPHNVVNFLF